MSTVGHHQPLYKLVTAHYLIAGLFFLALSVMLLFSVEALSGHYFQPKILALTHMAALGWGSMIIFGALYQLLPVILETKLYSTKLAWYSLVLFTSGIILLIYCFWVFDPGHLMQMAAMLILTAIVLVNINVFFTVRHKKQSFIVQDFILTACLWLGLTAFLGTLMVFNFQYPFLQKDHLHFLRLHAHMGIAGWFLMLIIGVSAKLMPMFLVSEYVRTGLLSWSYYLINAALLLFLVDGYLYGINYRTYLILSIGATGVFSYLFYIFRCFQFRIRQEIDLPMLKSLFSFVFLVAGMLILPFILYWHLKNDAIAVRLSTCYGGLIFMGWISMLIQGQTFKTLPFIVWVKHYEQLVGKVKTPLPSDLVNNILLYVQFAAFLFFLTGFLAGFLLNSYPLKMIAAVSLMITALSYLLQLVALLLHETKIEDYDDV
ncbi:hypothetical protein [Pedobacter nyackensis]|uniref:hypothetical protein n=1 Tax=Pedobacter nyackensis TaxID=475255 RepID=UPI002930A254|nr:hypothetical protein [Pedobacter nyackensis]